MGELREEGDRERKRERERQRDVLLTGRIKQTTYGAADHAI